MSFLILYVKTLLIGGVPVEPSQDDIASFEASEDLHGYYGQYPSPLEVHDWNVEFFTKKLTLSLLDLLLWRYVATSKRVPRTIRSLAWKRLHTLPAFAW